jgi:hypothetical protein
MVDFSYSGYMGKCRKAWHGSQAGKQGGRQGKNFAGRAAACLLGGCSLPAAANTAVAGQLNATHLSDHARTQVHEKMPPAGTFPSAANERSIPFYPGKFSVKEFGAKGDGITGQQQQQPPVGCMRQLPEGCTQQPPEGCAALHAHAPTSTSTQCLVAVSAHAALGQMSTLSHMPNSMRLLCTPAWLQTTPLLLRQPSRPPPMLLLISTRREAPVSCREFWWQHLVEITLLHCAPPPLAIKTHSCLATARQFDPLLQGSGSGFLNGGRDGVALLMPAGIYKITQTLDILQSNVVLRGEGVRRMRVGVAEFSCGALGALCTAAGHRWTCR